MKLSWDEAKRQRTLDARGLDFALADVVFNGVQFTREDLRREYGERRFITAGFLEDRMVVVVWTPRGPVRHIISMRKANDREQKAFKQTLED
ncbi:MAG: BrnT family toxin [Aestuariivirga sp.]